MSPKLVLLMIKPNLELKLFPSLLKYTFLDERKMKPLIISLHLDKVHEKNIFDILQVNE